MAKYIPRCKCGDAKAMGHEFNYRLRCVLCGRTFGEHQAKPRRCREKWQSGVQKETRQEPR